MTEPVGLGVTTALEELEVELEAVVAGVGLTTGLTDEPELEDELEDKLEDELEDELEGFTTTGTGMAEIAEMAVHWPLM